MTACLTLWISLFAPPSDPDAAFVVRHLHRFPPPAVVPEGMRWGETLPSP